MVKKFIALIIILILLSFSLYGCYDSFSIEEYAYVIAMGIDKGDENLIKLTLQFALSDSSSQGSSQSSKSSSITVECATIDTGINIVNSYISKVVNLSHCQILAISEVMAEQGIEGYIDTLINNIQIRPDCNLLITKCNASDYIKNANPILTDLVARYYEVLLSSESYTGYTVKTPVLELSTASHTPLPQYIALLAGLNTNDDKNMNYNNENNLNLIDKGVSLKPGQTPIAGNTVSQVIGLAILDRTKLIGELNSLETICYLILKNQLERCTMSIPSPFNNDDAIDITFELHNTSQSNIQLINYTPFITINVELTGIIQSYPSDIDYSMPENLKIIEEYSSSYIKSKLTEFLYKTAKNYNADIIDFGYQTAPMFDTIDEFQNSNWGSNYKNSFFKVNVSTNITSTSPFSVY